MDLVRGGVYLANLNSDSSADPKYWVVVSNNQRNRSFKDALVVRVTTTDKYTELASVVELPAGEVLHGWVRCDNLTTMYDDEPIKLAGHFSVAAMREIEAGLRATLGM